jgi:hypothetical protein
MPAGEAIVVALIATLLHFGSELFHHLGHAWAARQTGYPMLGIRFGLLGIFARSLYPSDEPELPARIHLRRALGGPLWSLALTIAGALIVFTLGSARGALWLLAVFFFVENLFVFTLQALVPLGFNDGATLWRLWLKR